MSGKPAIDINYDILRAMIEAGTNKSDIARNFGISRPTLDRIVHDYGLGHTFQR